MVSVFFFLKGCWLVVFKNIKFDTTIYFNLKMNNPKHVKYSNEIRGFCDFEAYCGCFFKDRFVICINPYYPFWKNSGA